MQGPRPEKDVYYGADHPNLHEPFGDTPEANLLGDDLVTEWDGSFVLYIGGPGARPELAADDAGVTQAVPPAGLRLVGRGAGGVPHRARRHGRAPTGAHARAIVVESMRWAGDFLTGAMRDWPDRELEIGSLFGEGGVNAFPASRFAATAEERDERRGRFIATMRWKLAADEALDPRVRRLRRLLDVHEHGRLLEQHGLPVPARELHAEPHRGGRRRTGAARHGARRSRLPQLDRHPGLRGGVPDLPERPEPDRSRRSRPTVVRHDELDAHLPADARRVTAAERAAQLHARFDAIRRRYRI